MLTILLRTRLCFLWKNQPFLGKHFRICPAGVWRNFQMGGRALLPSVSITDPHSPILSVPSSKGLSPSCRRQSPLSLKPKRLLKRTFKLTAWEKHTAKNETSRKGAGETFLAEFLPYSNTRVSKNNIHNTNHPCFACESRNQRKWLQNLSIRKEQTSNPKRSERQETLGGGGGETITLFYVRKKALEDAPSPKKFVCCHSEDPYMTH